MFLDAVYGHHADAASPPLSRRAFTMPPRPSRAATKDAIATLRR